MLILNDASFQQFGVDDDANPRILCLAQQQDLDCIVNGWMRMNMFVPHSGKITKPRSTLFQELKLKLD